MDSLKTALTQAKNELFSTPFFIVFGVVFILASAGFWQLGKTDIAKAYIIPTLVAGVLLIVIGVRLYANNRSRVNSVWSETDAFSQTNRFWRIVLFFSLGDALSIRRQEKSKNRPKNY